MMREARITMSKTMKPQQAAPSDQEALAAGQKTADHPRRPSFIESMTEEKNRNILLGVSVVQLVLAILMYMLASVNTTLLLIEAAVAVVLALFVRFGPQDSRVFRGIMRTVFILLISAAILFTSVVVIWTNSLRSLDNSEATQAMLTLSNWFMFADVTMPPLLYLQPVLALNTRGNRRFDRTLVRILSVLCLIGCILLCVFALNYSTPDGGEILTDVTYFPVVFGHTFAIPIAFENILTRILLCGLGAAMVVFSFLSTPLTRADARRKSKAEPKAEPEKEKA